MRVVFMGTPSFAVPPLRALAAAHEVVAVYTRPDAVSGRGATLRPSPVKEVADDLGLPVRQPTTLRDPSAVAELRGFDPDIIVVAAYGMILPRDVLEVPSLGCVNIHASLLPKWRGAAPIQRAILAGDEMAGVSIMLMEEGLDTGPFCAVAQTAIDDKGAEELTAELAELGARLLLEVLPSIEGGTCSWRAQQESEATYAAKITKADVSLLPELGVQDAMRRIRASTSQAPARARIGGKGVTILEAAVSDEPVRTGEVAATSTRVILGFGDGAIEVRQLKPDGKNVMDAAAWICGARLPDDTRWERP